MLQGKSNISIFSTNKNTFIVTTFNDCLWYFARMLNASPMVIPCLPKTNSIYKGVANVAMSINLPGQK